MPHICVLHLVESLYKAARSRGAAKQWLLQRRFSIKMKEALLLLTRRHPHHQSAVGGLLNNFNHCSMIIINSSLSTAAGLRPRQQQHASMFHTLSSIPYSILTQLQSSSSILRSYSNHASDVLRSAVLHGGGIPAGAAAAAAAAGGAGAAPYAMPSKARIRLAQFLQLFLPISGISLLVCWDLYAHTHTHLLNLQH